jgi:MFS family permease
MMPALSTLSRDPKTGMHTLTTLSAELRACCPIFSNQIVQVSDPSKANLYGAINTAYTVGAIVAGWFMGGPLADFAGRRVGMACGAILVIIATFMQCFSPRGEIGVFIAGRVVIGIGQGLALSMLKTLIPE